MGGAGPRAAPMRLGVLMPEVVARGGRGRGRLLARGRHTFQEAPGPMRGPRRRRAPFQPSLARPRFRPCRVMRREGRAGRTKAAGEALGAGRRRGVPYRRSLSSPPPGLDACWPTLKPFAVTTGDDDVPWPGAVEVPQAPAATTAAHAPRPKRAAALAAARVVHDALDGSEGAADDSRDADEPSPGPKRRRAARDGGAAGPSTPRPVSPATAAAEAARAGAAPPILPPLRRGQRKPTDLDSLDSIPDPTARRRARRLAKNRATAAASRTRRREQMQELVDRVFELEKEAGGLRAALDGTRAELAHAKAVAAAAAFAPALTASASMLDDDLLPAFDGPGAGDDADVAAA